MELQAVIAGLEAVTRPSRVQLITDSRYVAVMLEGARAKANQELVTRMREVAAPHQIRVQVVKAHSGQHALNERTDRLAQAAAREAMTTPRIANLKHFGSGDKSAALTAAFGERWLYIGRENKGAGMPASPLANPYKPSDFGGQKGATLPHYRRWLWGQIQAGDEAVIESLKAIDDSTVLVCWCAPGPCHGEVVRAAAGWLAGSGD